ncbi:MAG TPA: DNA polymerase III subunit epsilon [Acidiferrobacterales bacterium]|nr:DNA polymerase III subunit epsilon [Acidiferrobacterales bacterium]
MPRQIILDTETTGLEPSQGHRIIEIGAVEMLNRRLTGNRFHQYLNPEREIDAGAIEVHGITNEMLVDKPKFADIAADFLAFVQGAELIIHNAPFDTGFINCEFRLLGETAPAVSIETVCTVLDTLKLARKLRPGQKNDLDSLCRHYNIDNAQRSLHGALLDAEILADVYLAMTGGQATLFQEPGEAASDAKQSVSAHAIRRLGPNRPALVVIRASDEELAEHARMLDEIDKKSGGKCVWKELESTQ